MHLDPLLQEMARACFFSGLLEEGLPYCERAIDIAARLQAPEVQAEGLATLGLMLTAERCPGRQYRGFMSPA